ncbi:hypothetical protein QJS04_geneDACA020075 [Acorus gramineus]|uniref:Uncharacterized protein n=1 Tax=Acorus gramineus TaxID=55184 RepID=A0AAV9A599_ACOGR|nr:hypothetical protein QJS04_geneDACA020075 [Acorus gramineus]
MALPGAVRSVKQRRSTDSASNSEGEDLEDDASSMVLLCFVASLEILGYSSYVKKELIYDFV